MAPLQRFLVTDGLDGAAAEGFLSQERSVGLGAGFTLVVQRMVVDRATTWGRDKCRAPKTSGRRSDCRGEHGRGGRAPRWAPLVWVAAAGRAREWDVGSPLGAGEPGPCSDLLQGSWKILIGGKGN